MLILHFKKDFYNEKAPIEIFPPSDRLLCHFKHRGNGGLAQGYPSVWVATVAFTKFLEQSREGQGLEHH